MVSLSDGIKRGEIDDLVVDLSRVAVLGLVLSGKDGGYLSLSRVRGFGSDAVTIESEEALVPTREQGATFESLKELTVVDADGEILGHIDEIRFEPTGALQSLEVHKGGVLGIGAHVTQIPASAIRGVGPKILTVDLPSES